VRRPATPAAGLSYFGTTDPLPPGEPGGGITGIVAVPLFRGGLTVIPGSTFGGAMVPFCWDIRLLRFPPAAFPPAPFPLGGAIFSGGVDVAFGGATGTVGLAGDVGWGFCARAGTTTGAATRINAVNESVLSMERILLVMARPRPRS
jgi:hypothetical protein